MDRAEGSKALSIWTCTLKLFQRWSNRLPRSSRVGSTQKDPARLFDAFSTLYAPCTISAAKILHSDTQPILTSSNTLL
jgi:hypothetical protein